jgi:hypothetical protein
MPLHLIKLCVGCDSVEDLEAWIAETREEKRSKGLAVEQFHTTRMVPKRVDELVDGGSLYWIIKGGVQCRQRLTEIRPFVDGEGISRCRLMLDPVVVRTEWQPRRPFQGWRYLDVRDAPADLSGAGTSEELPLALRRELTELGLL